MTASVTVSNALRQAGRLLVRWSDGEENEFWSAGDVTAFVRGGTESGNGIQTLKALLMMRWRAADPNLANTALVVGRSINLDTTVNNIVTVS